MKPVLILFLCLVLLCAAVTFIFKDIIFTGDAKQPASTGLTVTVTDLNGAPLKNAKVKIPESGGEYRTDKNGKTGLMEVPFTQTALTRMVDGNFSTVTLTVFCDGYADFVLFNCLVYGDRARDGPVIRMHEASDGLPYVALVEIPPHQWILEFLKTEK